MASRITGNSPAAEEVVQDSLWAVVRKIDSFCGDSAFGTWFYQIVANRAYEKVRGRQSRRHDVSLDEVLPVFDETRHDAAPVSDWSSRVDDPATQTELRAVLSKAIAELPAAHRAALVLRDIEGRSNPEIAVALGLSIALVKVRSHRARLFLR